MKNTRSVLLGLLSFSFVLVLAAGCYRPAAPDVTPTSAEAEQVPGEADLEGTAMANSTRMAQTVQAQTAEAESPPEEEESTETDEEPSSTVTPLPSPTTAPPEADTPTPVAATPTTVPTTEPEEPSGPSETTNYVVQQGDTLYSIAVRYGTTVDAIVRANGLADASQISPGQELTIPAGDQGAQPPSQPAPGGNTYVVQPGDRLFRIALRYNMSWTRLAEYNGIVDPNSIYPGQVLRIPPQ